MTAGRVVYTVICLITLECIRGLLTRYVAVSNTPITRSSKHQANAFKIRVHDVSSNCLLFAFFALCSLEVCLMIDRCLLDGVNGV